MRLGLLLIGLCCCSGLLLSAQDIAHRLILIGDAGEINNEQEKLISAAAELTLPGITQAYFLGDNIYPTGMGLDDSAQRIGATILRSQFKPFREKGVPVYFMAGNHDWDKSGPLGLAKIKAQEAYLHAQADSGLRFVPEAGTLGPFVESWANDVVTVVYDSEFWVFPHADSLQGAVVREKERFRQSLDSLSDLYREKILLVLSHHPMRSYGEHSLHFSLSDHLFPLRKIRKELYIPLPVLGSLYPVLRSTVFRTEEDLKHPLYRELTRSVTGVLAEHPNVVYISGHDHGLQCIRAGNFMQVVSGSGSKTSVIRPAGDLCYRYGKQGFTVLDVLTDGKVSVSFYIVENGVVRKDFETTKDKTNYVVEKR